MICFLCCVMLLSYIEWWNIIYRRGSSSGNGRIKMGCVGQACKLLYMGHSAVELGIVFLSYLCCCFLLYINAYIYIAINSFWTFSFFLSSQEQNSNYLREVIWYGHGYKLADAKSFIDKHTYRRSTIHNI